MVTGDLLAWHHGGCENGGGASGKLAFDLETEMIALRHDARFTDYEALTYEF